MKLKNLCDFCQLEYSSCMNDYDTSPEIEYGDCGDGIADSVLKCSWFKERV